MIPISLFRIKNFFLVLLLLILSLILAACAVNPVTGEKELMLVSEPQEIAVGRGAAPTLKWSFGGEYRDPELKAYLGAIVRRLWANSERPHLPLEFYVQNTSVPNAFALPGYVAVTRGLLAEFRSEAEFAAVMGHETGHVMARHTAKRMTQSTLMQLGLVAGGAALSGTDGSGMLLRAGALGGTLLLLKFGREQELQADRLGVRYISEIGYEPRQALGAHQSLQTAVDKYLRRTGASSRGGSTISAILSTHPRQEVRIQEISDMVAQLPPYKLRGDGVHADRFKRMTAKMREVNKAYFPFDRAEKLFSKDDLRGAEQELKRAIKLNSSQAPFYSLYGMLRLKQDRYREAVEYFNRALGIDPGFQPAIFGRGMARMKREKYYPAIEDFKASLKLFPAHLDSTFGLGISYFELERYRDAVPHLRRVAQAVPTQPEVHGMLGICYEALGDLRAAVNEYALQLNVAPGNKYGRHARRRLEVLVPAPQPL